MTAALQGRREVTKADPSGVLEESIRVHCPEGGAVFHVRIRRQPAARRFTLRVSPRGEVLLAIPKRSSLIEAARFAQSHAGWIARRSSALPRPVPFAPGEVIPLRGSDHLIEHRAGRGTVWTEENPDRICVAGDASHVSRRLADGLRKWALEDLVGATEKYCHTLGLKPPAVQVRDPVSRWGSCSASGVISYSWRLIFAPGFVLDYLAAHEVAHLVHMNHSPKFWKVVAALSRDVDPAEAWLREHGASLHRFGRADWSSASAALTRV